MLAVIIIEENIQVCTKLINVNIHIRQADVVFTFKEDTLRSFEQDESSVCPQPHRLILSVIFPVAFIIILTLATRDYQAWLATVTD